MVQYAVTTNLFFWGREMARAKVYSDTPPMKCDAEIKRIIDEGYRVARTYH